MHYVKTSSTIIPQQETSGNYNVCGRDVFIAHIIPQQETSGNYNTSIIRQLFTAIIPQQETSGNYNEGQGAGRAVGIIPQQETSGNYNSTGNLHLHTLIIPQQETSGNYNRCTTYQSHGLIIPQQETSGNYQIFKMLCQYFNLLAANTNQRTSSLSYRKLPPNLTVTVGTEQSVRAIHQNCQGDQMAWILKTNAAVYSSGTGTKYRDTGAGCGRFRNLRKLIPLAKF